MAVKAKKEKNEKWKPPKRVQDIIPVSTIYDDGLFCVGGGKYSMSYKFSDINYISESADNETNLLIKYYSEILNTIDPYSITKLTLYKHRRDRAALERDVLLPAAGDELQRYREDANAFVLKAALGDNDFAVERMITVSVNRKNEAEARKHFDGVTQNMERSFSELGSTLRQLGVEERLAVMHSFFRAGEEGYFHFDIKEKRQLGVSFKDYVCPDMMEIKEDCVRMGARWGRVLTFKDYPKSVRDTVISDFLSVSEQMLISVDIIAIPQHEAVKMVEMKLLGVETNIANHQRRQFQRQNYTADVPYDLKKQQDDGKEMMDDITKRDQQLFEAVWTIAIAADSKEQLDADTETLKQVASKNSMQLGILYWQQIDGLNSALPYGVRRIDTFRTLTSESLSVFVPFNSREIYQPGGIFYGLNQISHTLIVANRKELLNGNMFILGAPGGGKSMQGKWEITDRVLRGDADVIIIDPEREYGKLVEALGGEVINISATSDSHINAMEINKSYNDGKNPVILKTEFLMSLCDLVADGELGAAEKSIIDRCAANVYRDYIDSGYTGTMPTLQDFRFELLQQPEQTAQNLALKMELFTSGSLNTFAQATNVDTQNSLISYDILDLGKQLMSVGMLVVLDSIWNRVTQNRERGRDTYIFIDEIYLLFQHEYSANFLFTLWKRVRKYGAYCTGITQNVDDLLQSYTARTMLANSEFLMLLNQSPTDRASLAELFNISDEEVRYITNAKAGHGLLRFGEAILPFENVFPKEDNELYRLMTTKPGEG